MVVQLNTFYAPALRMKAGELLGIKSLAPDIADRVLPRMIVPPPSERDDHLQAQLFTEPGIPDVSVVLSNSWGQRPVLLEPSHLMKEFGRTRMDCWLPQMFDRARAALVPAIPLIQARHLQLENIRAYRASIDYKSILKFGIVISSSDLDRQDVIDNVLLSIDMLNIDSNDCVVIADFHASDLSQPKLVAPIISGVLEDLQSKARWQQIIFQGTTYPEKNPAQPGSSALVPRNEWHAWRQAVRFDPQTEDYMIFGDYAADCSKISFGGRGGAAIPHYRYTTPTSWLVQRGLEKGTHRSNMQLVCKKIVESGDFAGRAFSSADNYIYQTAKGLDGPGNSKDWRAMNTNHHITRVVSDIGNIKGVAFKRAAVVPELEQALLL